MRSCHGAYQASKSGTADFSAWSMKGHVPQTLEKCIQLSPEAMRVMIDLVHLVPVVVAVPETLVSQGNGTRRSTIS
jgi:hypothetical protein